MLVVAAKAGVGIALVPKFLVGQELNARELVTPFEFSLASDKGYYVVYPERKQNSTLLQAFEACLVAAACQYPTSESNEQPPARP